ncbi:hypothetical protein HanIR_Chr14g0686671 [Helianthus annuus]|nr:hypothetical protein HanIR_Chr14g0686671 [Helianthus annuus]
MKQEGNPATGVIIIQVCLYQLCQKKMKKKLKSDSYVCICCSMFFEVPVQNSWVDATFSRESVTSIFESSIKKQVQCPLKVVNMCSSRDVVVLDFYYKFGTYVVMILV